MIRACPGGKRDCFGGTVERSADVPLPIERAHQEDVQYSSWQYMAGRCKKIGISLNKRDSNLFPNRTVKQWITLSREVMRYPSLEVFKTGMNEALSNLNCPYSWLYFHQGAELKTSWFMLWSLCLAHYRSNFYSFPNLPLLACLVLHLWKEKQRLYACVLLSDDIVANRLAQQVCVKPIKGKTKPC